MTKPTKIIVMSDLHLGAPGTVQYGLDTAARFANALEDAAKLYGDADLCIFAGDIADEADPAAYRLFEDMRLGLDLPQCVLLGNHDDRNIYLAHGQNPMLDANGFVQGVREIGQHRVIMLDSSEPGHVEGILCQSRLGWLAEQLAVARDKQQKVILVLHHNPQKLHMPVDRYSLARSEELLAVLKASGVEIPLIIAGHCHITSAGSWGGYAVVSISGNQHRVAPFLPGMRGQQACYEGAAHFAVIMAEGDDATVHFHGYVDRNIELPAAMFPWKLDQWQKVPDFLSEAETKGRADAEASAEVKIDTKLDVEA
ncbi:metallophosphoesterase [Paracoccus sp. (in: a-proteobacteria)]|uniref:metallophosphoesterase n=1 Tax=Paracoccus sp. TaxID=267 RepID=UPI00289FF76B|nr:metallophosphoesterase [Paracoccus sp. (in: a-proteobacteria)]